MRCFSGEGLMFSRDVGREASGDVTFGVIAVSTQGSGALSWQPVESHTAPMVAAQVVFVVGVILDHDVS
jgi:hypothetical protein